jgi:hypothetical protein
MARRAWAEQLDADPTDWLLEHDIPGVRASALRHLLDQGPGCHEYEKALTDAMRTDPIAGILDAQDDEGWWDRPGAGYGRKYRSTAWNLMFLDQLGADPRHPGVQRACSYVMDHTATEVGGFGASGSKSERRPPPSSALHCLNGNLAHALIGFGHLEHPVTRAATDWAARTVLGEDVDRWYASGTSGPRFACGVNDNRPCAWGAIKELRALAAIPPVGRTDRERRAIERGLEFLLSKDPAVADYPMPDGDTKPSSSWFKLGFPSGYVADVVQNLEVLAALGVVADARLDNVLEFLIAQSDHTGRWHNRYAYAGKTTVPIEAQGAISKWVTLRAASVLRARYGD